MVDSLRLDHAYGDGARTPNINALTRMGLSYTRHHPEAMPTIPFRKSLLSGQRGFPFRNWHDYRGLIRSPGWEPLDSTRLTFTSVLRRAGYWTAYVTDNPFLGYAKPYEGFRSSFSAFSRVGGQVGGSGKGVSDRLVRRYVHRSIDDPQTRGRVRRYLAGGQEYFDDESRSFVARNVKQAIRLMPTAARSKPFCMVLDTFQAHEPWTPPDKYLRMYAEPDALKREPSRPYYGPLTHYRVPPQDVPVARMRALYAAEVTMVDRWLGVFFDQLEKRKLLDDTIVVFTADHGFYFGEHGVTGKVSTLLHPELIRTPLTIVHPEGKKAGRESRYLASSHDIAPTILRMCGVPAPKGMTGHDLSRIYRGKKRPGRPYQYGGYSNSFYYRSPNWTLFGLNTLSELKLYNVRRDRGEFRNVASRERAKARQLYSTVLKKSGGRLPYYPNT